MVQRELNLVLAWRAENLSFRLKNMETEGPAPAPPPRAAGLHWGEGEAAPAPTPEVPLPQGGAAGQCPLPVLGGGCYWSASCFAPEKAEK